MDTLPRWPAALFVAILVAGCGVDPITNLGCDGGPEAEAGLRNAEQLRDRCGLDEDCWNRALGEARALVERYPGELAAHRAYVLSRFRGNHGEYGPEGEAIAEAYRHRLERRPDDAGLLYLNALLTENRRDRRELLEQSVARAPDFPWPRYALAIEHGWDPDVEERAAAREEGARFVAACPDRLGEIQRLASALDDAALFDQYRERFVESFQPLRERFSELATLWQQSFEFAKVDLHPAIRSQVAVAVAATAALERGADRAWLRALEIGYRITGDGAGSLRVEELVLTAFPCEPQAMSIRDRRFRMARPQPPRDDAAFDGWRRAQLADVDELLASCPASGFLRMRELRALAAFDRVPEERFVAAGKTLAAARDLHLSPSNPAFVARRFLEKGVGVGEIPRLLEQDRVEMDLESARALQFVLDDADRERTRVERLLRSAGHLALRSELALRDRALSDARSRLAETLAAIEAVGEGARDDAQRQGLAAAQAEYGRLRAEIAQASGDSAAAPAADGLAIVSDPSLASLGKVASEAPQVVPNFRSTDLTGREWTPADLEGKAVLLNFWATWCGPCVAEMPFLSKLARRFRDDPRVLIVGVNVDESPGPVQPFIEKLGCDYPILLGGAAAWAEWRLVAIPRNLILDPSGRVVASEVAFGPDGDRWMETMAARLIEAAAGGAPGKS